MKTFNAFVGKLETVVGVVMMTTITFMVFIAAVTRYLGAPIVWSVDLAQLLFIWVCMLGADAAMKNKAHVGMDMIVRAFPVKLQKMITFGTYILCLCFLVFCAYYGFTLCVRNSLRMYATLKISYSYGTAAVPVGSVLMILTVIEQLGDLIRGWADPRVGVVGDLDPNGPLPPVS